VTQFVEIAATDAQGVVAAAAGLPEWVWWAPPVALLVDVLLLVALFVGRRWLRRRRGRRKDGRRRQT
jgi:membrane protein implicated in regulation of membrane protease activity